VLCFHKFEVSTAFLFRENLRLVTNGRRLSDGQTDGVQPLMQPPSDWEGRVIGTAFADLGLGHWRLCFYTCFVFGYVC